jgi:hypothetical protein
MGHSISDDAQSQIFQHAQAIARLAGGNLQQAGNLIGREWEQIVSERLCNEYGSENVKNVSKQQLPYDFIVLGKKIQCKSRAQKNCGGRNWVKIAPGNGALHYAEGDVDFFALRLNGKEYVFPFSALRKASHKSHARFKASAGSVWRDNWAIIGQGVDVTAVRPGMLFPGGA